MDFVIEIYYFLSSTGESIPPRTISLAAATYSLLKTIADLDVITFQVSFLLPFRDSDASPTPNVVIVIASPNEKVKLKTIMFETQYIIQYLRKHSRKNMKT